MLAGSDLFQAYSGHIDMVICEMTFLGVYCRLRIPAAVPEELSVPTHVSMGPGTAAQQVSPKDAVKLTVIGSPPFFHNYRPVCRQFHSQVLLW